MSYRTNEEWIAELRGERSEDQQRQAHEDLGKYLYTVAYNYILKRQSNLVILRDFAPEELAALAQDFVQETLLKLSAANFALLDQFQAHGRFTSWAAAIVVREAGQELRRSYWTRRGSMPTRTDSETDTELPAEEFIAAPEHHNPERLVIARQQLQEADRILPSCLDRLLESRRIAFYECQVRGRPAQAVAEQLGVTENAVSILVYRAKRDLRRCLQRSGIGADILDIFE